MGGWEQRLPGLQRRVSFQFKEIADGRQYNPDIGGRVGAQESDALSKPMTRIVVPDGALRVHFADALRKSVTAQQYVCSNADCRCPKSLGDNLCGEQSWHYMCDRWAQYRAMSELHNLGLRVRAG